MDFKNGRPFSWVSLDPRPQTQSACFRTPTSGARGPRFSDLDDWRGPGATLAQGPGLAFLVSLWVSECSKGAGLER